jgi:hypothetical protein
MSTVGNFARDLALEGKSIAQIALIAVRPQVLIGICSDQLRRDSNLLASAQDRPFHHAINVQLPSNPWQRLASAFVLHSRGAGDHP